MNKSILRGIIVAAMALCLSCAAALADTYTFALVPTGGSINGAPGSLIGWGYSITNDSFTNWLEPLTVNAGIFQHATLDIGDYFDFPLIAPSQTVTEAFTSAGVSGFGSGLAGLTWALSAPLGFVNTGNFDLSACWANSAGACVQSAPDDLAAYSATVATVATVPEPPTWLVGAFMLLILFSDPGLRLVRIILPSRCSRVRPGRCAMR